MCKNDVHPLRMHSTDPRHPLRQSIGSCKRFLHFGLGVDVLWRSENGHGRPFLINGTDSKVRRKDAYDMKTLFSRPPKFPDALLPFCALLYGYQMMHARSLRSLLRTVLPCMDLLGFVALASASLSCIVLLPIFTALCRSSIRDDRYRALPARAFKTKLPNQIFRPVLTRFK